MELKGYAATICDVLKRERVIVWIALLTFVISAGYALIHRIQPAVDASAYNQIGWNIAQGRGYRLTLDVPPEQDESITYQGPFYPTLLAGIFTVFDHRLEAVWIIQALLRAISVVLMYAICLRIFGPAGRQIGWIASGLFGAYPDLIEIAAMLLSETWFLFLTLLIVWIFFRSYERPRIVSSAVLGATFGVAVLTRSSILLFGLVIAYWCWKRRALVPFIAFGVAAGLVLTPWTIRNASVYRAFIPTMANAGYNLWVGNRVGGTGDGGNPPELHEIQRTYGMVGANAYFADQYAQFVTQHPLDYVGLTAGRFMKYFSVVRPMGFWFYQTGIAQILFVASSVVASFFLFSLGAAGISIAWLKERNEKLRTLSLFVALTVAAVVPVIITTRYRLPIYPFFSIFAAYAVVRWRSDRKAFTPYALGGIAAVTAIAVVDAATQTQKIAEHFQLLFGK